LSEDSSPLKIQDLERPDRYLSHALVEVKKFKNLPFFCDSAVLLDLSSGGFKLEFTNEVRVEPGSRYWLSIPLSPLGIYAPKYLQLRSECRWFDDSRFRIGGTFIDLNKKDQMILEQVVENLLSRKQI